MLVNLQGAAVTFMVGRHHHHGPFCEGRGLTHALTVTPPTDLTVATHSPLGAQPQSDRILRVQCAAGWCQALNSYVPPRCPEALLPQIQPSGEQERLKCAIGLPQALVRRSKLLAAALVPMVETGECGDVETRSRPRSDGTCLCRARKGHIGTCARKPFQIWAFEPATYLPVVQAAAPD